MRCIYVVTLCFLWCAFSFASHLTWSTYIGCNMVDAQPAVVDRLTIVGLPCNHQPFDYGWYWSRIPTELIINVTGSYNKRKKACAHRALSHSLCIKSWGHWMGGNYSSFISIALSLFRMNVFHLFLFLITHSLSHVAGKHVPSKRLCGWGIRYDLVMLLMERLARECELCFFSYLFIF